MLSSINSKVFSLRSPSTVSHRCMPRAPCPRSVTQEAPVAVKEVVADVPGKPSGSTEKTALWSKDSSKRVTKGGSSRSIIMVQPTKDATSLSEIVASMLGKGTRPQLQVKSETSNYTALKGIALTSETLKAEEYIATARPSLSNKTMPVLSAGGLESAPVTLYVSKVPARLFDGSNGKNILKVGKSTPVQGLSAKIVELLSVKPASLNISLVGEPAAEIAIIALLKARFDLSSKDIDLLFSSEMKLKTQEDGRVLEIVTLTVVNTDSTGKKKVVRPGEAKGAEVTLSSSAPSEPMISVPVKEWETLRQQVLELAQQNIDLTKIITAQIRRQE